VEVCFDVVVCLVLVICCLVCGLEVVLVNLGNGIFHSKMVKSECRMFEFGKLISILGKKAHLR